MSITSRNALLLLFLLLFSAMFLSACSDPEGGEKIPSEQALEQGGETGAEEPPKWLDEAPGRDFGGYSFKMYIEDGLIFMDTYVEEETGEPVDDAVWMRNKIVEDRFNIDIEPIWYTYDWGPSTPGENSILAGDEAFDVIFSHGRVAYMYVNKNLVADWIENMPYADLSKSWWNQDVVEECSFFGRLYAATGDIAYSTLRQTLCIYFNKNLFAALGIPYPYDDVKSGAWTLDKLAEVAKLGTADLNGDGAMTFGEDRFGFAMWNQWTFPTAALYIGGDKIVKKDENGHPVLAMYTPRAISIYEKLFEMLDDNVAFCPVNDMTPSQPVFMSGLALFHDAGMGGAVMLREMEDDIGIIPYPKYDARTPRYFSFMDANARMITVPKTAGDFERTGIILEAMASESQRTVFPAYYELTLKTKHSRDDESYEMLDIIKDSIVIDWGYLNDSLLWPLSSVGGSLIPKSSVNFTSFYEKNESAASSSLRKFIEDNA